MAGSRSLKAPTIVDEKKAEQFKENNDSLYDGETEDGA